VLSVVGNDGQRRDRVSLLDDIVREGAQRMLAAALEAEVELVIVGVRADGTKELVALAGGYRESTGSWGDLLRDCARRGMRAPVLAVGDGALGFWAALREVFPRYL
jgi:transposase-like protein